MKKQNKYVYVNVLQSNGGYGWDDEMEFDSYIEARKTKLEYIENCPKMAFRIISRRVLNETK